MALPGLLKIGEPFGESFLLAAKDGVVLDATPRALEMLGQGQGLVGQRLQAFSPDGPGLDRYLSLCVKSTSAIPGCLVVGARGSETRWRCYGARFAPTAAEPPSIALKLMPQRAAVSQFEQLNSQLDALNSEVSHRRAVEEQLRESNRVLQATADSLAEEHRRRDAYLATLAHELRNPLAPLRNAAAIIQMAGEDRQACEQARVILDRQVGQMVRLIDDLLDVSRIAIGKLVLKTERTELAAALKSAIEIAMPLIGAAHHELSVRFPSSPVYLDADPVRLAQVFGNLLNNAAKYTPSGGHIQISADCEDGVAVVRIRDSGKGIPPQMLQSIFEMFTQVDSTLERSEGGLGIGLTLAKTLVEMQGGSISAQSEGAGKGSLFTVRMPLAASAAVPGKRASARARKSGKKKILVVDDNRDAADSLVQILRLFGHESITANDGLKAVEQAQHFDPDAIIMDIGMPVMNGYEAARRIRTLPGGEKRLLIALTGWGQRDDKQQAIEAGFDAHLTKPVQIEELESVLERRHQ